MISTYFRALAVQKRSLWALSLREVMVKHGRHRIGYLWELLKTAFGVVVFWVIREAMGFKAPYGMPLPIFLLTGFVVWHIFSDNVSRAAQTVRSNKAMLAYPQVTQLDLHLAGLIVIWVTEVLILGIFLLVVNFLGYKFALQDYITFLSAILGIGVFSLAVGLVIAALKVYLPVLEKIVPMIMRILFFTSGVFFSPDRFAGKIGDVLMWNPVACYIELVRSTFWSSTAYLSPHMGFIVTSTVVALALGLLLERHVRRITEQE